MKMIDVPGVAELPIVERLIILQTQIIYFRLLSYLSVFVFNFGKLLQPLLRYGLITTTPL